MSRIFSVHRYTVYQHLPKHLYTLTDTKTQRSELKVVYTVSIQAAILSQKSQGADVHIFTLQILVLHFTSRPLTPICSVVRLIT